MPPAKRGSSTISRTLSLMLKPKLLVVKVEAYPGAKNGILGSKHMQSK